MTSWSHGSLARFAGQWSQEARSLQGKEYTQLAAGNLGVFILALSFLLYQVTLGKSFDLARPPSLHL